MINRLCFRHRQIDGDHIRPFARFQRASLLAQAKCARPIQCRHSQRPVSRDSGRIARYRFCQNRSRFKLTKHIEIIITCRTIGSNRNIHPGAIEYSHRAKSTVRAAGDDNAKDLS